MQPATDCHRDSGEAILPRFSLDRRVTILVLLATFLVLGSLAMWNIPLELIPRGYEESSLQVRALWNNAPAQEVLDKLTLPLEQELSTIPGLLNLNTFTTTGLSRCFISFKHGSDMGVVYREVRDRIERAKARMPEDLDRVLISKQDATSIPVYAMGLTIDPELTDAYNLIQTEVLLPLRRIDGVAAVDIQGLAEKEVLIELDRERTAAAGLNIYQIGLELGADNFTLASGTVRSAGKKMLLRSVARFVDLEAIKHRRVGGQTRLEDIARVSYREPEVRYRARANSQPAAFLVIFKEGEANALEVGDKVVAAIERMRKNPRLDRLGMTDFFNQGSTIRDSLGVMIDSGRIGALFAALVLFFFLRRFRMTLIISLSIPLSLFIGITALYFAGETLNVLSLLGLMISVGLLVDNSVVVAENIFRLHRQGLDRRQAAIRGAGEISLAVLMATLTTIVVFLPVSLVDGKARFLMMRLSLPITASLLASLVVALIFVPLAVYLTLPSKTHKSSSGRLGIRLQEFLRRLYEPTVGRVNRTYTQLLAVFLGRRVDLLLLLMAICVATYYLPMQQVELTDVQEEEGGFVEIDMVMPPGNTLADSDAYFAIVEQQLEENLDRLDLDGYFIFHRAHHGEVQGWFKKPRKNELTPRQVTEEILALMPEKAGAKLYTGLESDDEESTEKVEVMTLVGNDAAQLDVIATRFEEVLVTVPGVLGAKRSGELEASELGLVVNRDLAQRLDLSPAAVAGVVRNAIGGRSLPKIYRDGREIPVRVQFQLEDRERLDQLFDFRVPAGNGELVALGTVTEASRLPTTQRIFRRNKQVARTITLELEEDAGKETRDQLWALAAKLDLPEGVRLKGERQSGGQQADQAALKFAILLSIAFIYLLMGFLFESFILPLSIVPTIPLAILGVYWIHYAAGFDLDMLGMVGVVLLIGVVVNNGIVLVDTINRLRAEGESRRRAVLESADRRFRPIMMTALTTVCGMVPLTLAGSSSIGLSYTSFGLTLIGGMTTATVLTLLVVPVAYTLFDDLGDVLLRVLRRMFSSEPAAADTATR